MFVTTFKPEFDDIIKDKIKVASLKRCETAITKVNDFLYVSVYASSRPVGRFVFELEDENAILIKRFIIEREFYPLEFCLSELTKYLRKKKIKYLLWNND